MTLPIERARSRRPITWLTLIGVLLLPAVVGGILVAALYNPIDRLDNMSAAIVNEDDPVTIDGQLIPLGRQLTAGLVEGSDDVPSNIDWSITNAEKAAEGLADGRYSAIVTIPENFSAAATSSGQTLAGSDAAPEQATIDVQTAPDALIVDDAITAQVTATAASVMGTTLSSTTLENVFIGYSTLGDKLAEAADGATALADGAHSAADGAAKLPDGAAQLSSGATGISTGAAKLGSGLSTLADKTRDAGDGATQIAGGLTAISSNLTSTAPDTVGGTAATATANAQQAAEQATALAQSIGGMLQTYCQPTSAEPAPASMCQSLSTALDEATATATSAGTAAGYAAGVQQGLNTITNGTAHTPGLSSIAKSTAALGSGLARLAGGIDQTASGAGELSSGAGQLADGIDAYGAGTGELADGLGELAGGADALADGMGQAAASVPVFSDTEARNLAEVVADPVAAEGVGSNLFGASAIPLLAVLALWVGAIASFVALQAVSRGALASRRPSAVLALRGLAPAAALGAAQGLIVAGIVQAAASYDWGTWSVFAVVCVIAGVSFAAVNQALVAVFGGAGRWIAAVVGVLSVATGVVSTVPGPVAAIASAMPTAPAYNAMIGALTSAAGVGAGVVGMLVWTGAAVAVTTLAVVRRRTTTARALLAAPA